jgi:hypothetical protein
VHLKGNKAGCIPGYYVCGPFKKKKNVGPNNNKKKKNKKRHLGHHGKEIPIPMLRSKGGIDSMGIYYGRIPFNFP